MNIVGRLRAMLHLGERAFHLGERTRNDAVAEDEAARLVRLGDVDGQTERALAQARKLDQLALGGK